MVPGKTTRRGALPAARLINDTTREFTNLALILGALREEHKESAIR